MGLIKIEEFSGSEIANAAMEALEMVGIVNKLNINGYHLDIVGIQEPTPKGMIDDTPNKHRVVIERNKYVMQINKHEYQKLISDSVQYKAVIQKMQEDDIPFKQSENIKIKASLVRDDSDYLWYNHKIEFEVNKVVLETLESYVKKLFEETANYVINTFESIA